MFHCVFNAVKRAKPHRTYRPALIKNSFWKDIFHRSTPSEFSQEFRMSKECFLSFFLALLSKIERKLYRRKHYGGPYFSPPVVKLAVALRYLAGGSFHDIRHVHKITKRSCYRYLLLVVQCILEDKTIGGFKFEPRNTVWENYVEWELH